MLSGADHLQVGQFDYSNLKTLLSICTFYFENFENSSIYFILICSVVRIRTKSSHFHRKLWPLLEEVNPYPNKSCLLNFPVDIQVRKH
jgi:hypothetical protein